MFMQSNQPFQQDSVLDGALIGAAAGAGMMYGATKAAPSIQKYTQKQAKTARADMTKHALSMRGDVQKARKASFDADMNSVKSPGAMDVDKVSKNAAAAGVSAAEGSQNMKQFKSAKNEYKTNKKLGQLAGKMQGTSTKGRIAMYGGSVIAGALGGAMIDNGN